VERDSGSNRRRYPQYRGVERNGVNAGERMSILIARQAGAIRIECSMELAGSASVVFYRYRGSAQENV